MAGRNSNGGLVVNTGTTTGEVNDGPFVGIDGLAVLKSSNGGDEEVLQPNAWVFGPIGDDFLGGWSKYLGGDINDPDSYEKTDSINRSEFPDI